MGENQRIPLHLHKRIVGPEREGKIHLEKRAATVSRLKK